MRERAASWNLSQIWPNRRAPNLIGPGGRGPASLRFRSRGDTGAGGAERPCYRPESLLGGRSGWLTFRFPYPLRRSCRAPRSTKVFWHRFSAATIAPSANMLEPESFGALRGAISIVRACWVGRGAFASSGVRAWLGGRDAGRGGVERGAKTATRVKVPTTQRSVAVYGRMRSDMGRSGQHDEMAVSGVPSTREGSAAGNDRRASRRPRGNLPAAGCSAKWRSKAINPLSRRRRRFSMLTLTSDGLPAKIVASETALFRP